VRVWQNLQNLIDPHLGGSQLFVQVLPTLVDYCQEARQGSDETFCGLVWIAGSCLYVNDWPVEPVSIVLWLYVAGVACAQASPENRLICIHGPSPATYTFGFDLNCTVLWYRFVQPVHTCPSLSSSSFVSNWTILCCT